MENQVRTIRIDNPPEELRHLLQNDLRPLDFRDCINIGEYICEATSGTFLLITRSEALSGGVHVSVLQNGAVKDIDLCPSLLKRILIGVQMVSKGNLLLN